MSKEDLIYMSERSLEERRAIGRKGGLVRSEKKRLANSLSNIKHGKYAKIINYGLIKDPLIYSDYMLSYLRKTENLDLNKDQKIKLLSVAVQIFKVLHGERVNVYSRNLNLDISGEAIIDDITETKFKTWKENMLRRNVSYENEESVIRKVNEENNVERSEMI